MYAFSRRLAWIAGVVLPVGETLRRWGTWWDYPPAYLDDVLIGAFLIVGAAMSHRDRRTGQPCLSASWGFALGNSYLDLFLNISNIAQPDPSGVPGAVAFGIRTGMIALAVAGLIGAIRGPRVV